MPRFLYMGTSGPAFRYWEESPEAWQEWYWEQYEVVGASPDYLSRGDYAVHGIVGEYSLSDPGEWFGDKPDRLPDHGARREASSALEEHAVAETRAKINEALREVWPGLLPPESGRRRSGLLRVDVPDPSARPKAPGGALSRTAAPGRALSQVAATPHDREARHQPLRRRGVANERGLKPDEVLVGGAATAGRPCGHGTTIVSETRQWGILRAG